MDIVEYNPANPIRHPWELVRLEMVLRLIRGYAASKDRLRILDLGCGDCFFSLALLDKKIPATIIGIDPAYSPDNLAIKRASIKHPDFHLFNNTDDAKQLLQEPVDLVLLLDVIEHIPDEIAFLQEMVVQDFINPQTRFIVTVPAYQSLFTSHDEFLLHARRYNNRSLKRALHSGGLQPIETGYFFFILLPVRILQKLKEKIMGKPRKNHGLGGWKQGPFVTGIVKGLLSIDIAITRSLKKIGINFPGLSNYAVCKRPVS